MPRTNEYIASCLSGAFSIERNEENEGALRRYYPPNLAQEAAFGRKQMHQRCKRLQSVAEIISLDSFGFRDRVGSWSKVPSPGFY